MSSSELAIKVFSLSPHVAYARNRSAERVFMLPIKYLMFDLFCTCIISPPTDLSRTVARDAFEAPKSCRATPILSSSN